MHRKLTLVLAVLLAYSAAAQETPPSVFSVNAPQAKEVVLRGQWSKEAIPLTKGEKGEWSVSLPGVPGGVWEYSFTVDGVNVIDAKNPALKPQRQPGKSTLHIPVNPPAPWDWQNVPHGTVHTHGYPSTVLSRPREVVVYTPPGYEKDPSAKYPLLVLQHGSGDNQRTWVEHGKAHWILDSLIATKKAVPMIVLMLDGHPHGMVGRDATDAKRVAAQEAFERELLDEAIPLVENLYRVETAPEKRGIAGLSMGGAQSLSVGMANLDKFAHVAAFSAGPPNPARVEKFVSEPAAANEKLKLLWIACGKEDFLVERSEKLAALLKEKGIRHEWRLTAGDHSWPVWRGYLAELAPLLFR